MEFLNFIIVIAVSFFIAFYFQSETSKKLTVFIKASFTEFVFVVALVLLQPQMVPGLISSGINIYIVAVGAGAFMAILIGLKATFPHIG